MPTTTCILQDMRIAQKYALNGELVGGLYGVRLGKIFYGESMFSRYSNASKYAFIRYVEFLKSEGVELIDCQVYTAHLESLGARMIPRNQFLNLVKSLYCKISDCPHSYTLILLYCLYPYSHTLTLSHSHTCLLLRPFFSKGINQSAHIIIFRINSQLFLQ